MPCKECGHKKLIVREDDAGEYEVCASCGLRQDGLAELQKRFPLG